MYKLLTTFTALLTIGTLYLYQQTHNKSFSFDKEFEKLLQTSKIKFNSEIEKQYRRQIFIANKNYINKQKKNVRYKMAINEYSIYTFEEFKEKFNMKTFENKINQNSNDIPQQKQDKNLQYIKKKNWVGTLDQTPVRSLQTNCTAGYAIATSELLESWVLKTRYTYSQLSPQELLDCSWNERNNGCSGGLPSQALDYVVKNGISKEDDYQFRAIDQQCQRRQPFAGIQTYEFLETPDDVMNALDNMPIVVALEFERNMQFYSGGIYRGNPNCGKQSINHFVLCSGYYYDSKPTGQKFWYLKHNFGTNWGDKGYMAIDIGFSCGVSRNYYNVGITSQQLNYLK